MAINRFHVIAGQIQTMTRLAKDTFNDRKAALLCHCTAGNIQAGDQHAFFTGKTHLKPSFLKYK